MSDLFDADESAKLARDAALRRVADNGGPWHGRALSALVLLKGYEGTFEDIRLTLIRKGLPNPHHHNAWGALSKAAEDQHILVPTGKFRHMQTTKSHARRTAVYYVK